MARYLPITSQLFVTLLLFNCINLAVNAQRTTPVRSAGLNVTFTQAGISAISSEDDPYHANFLSGTLGRPVIRYRVGGGDWLTHYMGETLMTADSNSISYNNYIKGMPMRLVQKFTIENGIIDWDIKLNTEMDFPVTVGDFAIPVPWRKPGGINPENTFEKGFIKHHYIAGDGSFIFFTRPSGKPPYLIITAKPGTRLEYFEAANEYSVFIHSFLSGKRQEGNWRYKHTSCKLAAAGEEKSSIKYGFRIQCASSYDQLRDILVKNGLLDIRVIPGMTIPRDLEARIAIRSEQEIDSITSEYPEQTSLSFEKDKKGYSIYKASFRHLGENMLTIHYAGGLKNHLEFFSTESIETLFKKRAAFIVNKQQHLVPGKWWDGLYSVYDMKNGVLRGPEDTDGYDHWWGYVLACDDPALCKAPYVAAKNVYFPVKDEISSLEYYLEKFVWGGLQRTDKETPYPYGIYGTPNWMVNRDPLLRAGVKDRNLDKMNVWRSYDYPHIIMLYFHMYQLAGMYPDLLTYLDADAYLERAWQTARAYFTYPYQILPWYDTYKWGCYNELVIEDLIFALENNNRTEEAKWLRNEYEKKVKYFIYDDKYPYRSEYSIDRTAFESSYAFARYGMTNTMKADTNLWYDVKLKKWWSHPTISQDSAASFMERQHMAGLAVRGWLENKYFLLGSDFTISSDKHCLSYMARMGGWSILDYGLRFAEKPYDWIQLGYASYLSAWALMNTGDKESNYGYWAPGKENDGATGWAFMASKKGRAWIRKDIERGAWHYDGEQDLGHGSAVRTACSVLAEDPVFGMCAYGASLRKEKKLYAITPKDGLRSRFWAVTNNHKMGIELERDGFKKDSEIIFDNRKGCVTATIENRGKERHFSRIWLSSPDKWEIRLDGKKVNITTYGSRKYALLDIKDKIHTLQMTKE